MRRPFIYEGGLEWVSAAIAVRVDKLERMYGLKVYTPDHECQLKALAMTNATRGEMAVISAVEHRMLEIEAVMVEPFKQAQWDEWVFDRFMCDDYHAWSSERRA